MEYWGTTKIKNPKTLQKWIKKGWFQREIDNGYIFNAGCGRFRDGKCECHKCRKSKSGNELKKILLINGIE